MSEWSKPNIVVKPPGPKAQAWINRDKVLMSTSLTRTAPLVGVEGKGVFIKDPDGNTFLDWGAGIAVSSVGQCHPKVVKAIQDAAADVTHVNSLDYYTTPQIEYAERIAKLAPMDFRKRVFFANDGSGAVDGAIKIAKASKIAYYGVGFIGGFHGRTMGAVAFTTNSTGARKHFWPTYAGAVHVPFANCYRCPFNKEYPDCDIDCWGYTEDVMFQKVIDPSDTSFMLVEPFQGAGGYIVPPKEFMHKMRKFTEENDIVLIYDEVQTGFGRTGKWWASQHLGVQPDIMISSKAMASGLPCSVIISKAEMQEPPVWWDSAHEGTLNGNPIVMSAALAVLDIIEEEKLVENAEKVGNYMKKRFRELQEKYPVIGDIRGEGLFIGVELVKDLKTKEPAKKLKSTLITEGFKEGILLLGAGDSTLRICPPLIMEELHVDQGIEIIEKLLKKHTN
ncbi:MAG: aminotransferase class III-fold pyridoxal phosphate-dependent enzyme [Candidatus Ranarchaeia archaeon]